MLRLESYGLKVIQILLFLITTLWTVKKAYTCIPSAHISINLDKVTWETPKATAHTVFTVTHCYCLRTQKASTKIYHPAPRKKQLFTIPAKITWYKQWLKKCFLSRKHL